jgi:hypothetical protein
MGIDHALSELEEDHTPPAETGHPPDAVGTGRDDAVPLRLPSGSPRRRKRKTNPSLQAMRQQEARYTRLVGGLTVQQMRRISAVRKARGIRAAISAAKRMGG